MRTMYSYLRAEELMHGGKLRIIYVFNFFVCIYIILAIG